jgi:hypothetical protein
MRRRTIALGACTFLIAAVAGYSASLTAQAPGAAPDASAPVAHGPPNDQIDPKFAELDKVHGAVLCGWMIVLNVKAFHDRCHPTADGEVAAALNDASTQLDQFIATNTPIPIEEAKSRTTGFLANATQSLSCDDPDAEHFYQQMKARGPVQIRAWMTDMLSAPRPPVMSPCL